MKELVKTIDPELKYVKHITNDEMIQIHIRSSRKKVKCPYCGEFSSRVHSMYIRKFDDLPIQGMKVEVILNNRKFFCSNSECSHKTFAETFSCLPKMGRRSERLTKAIINTATNLSSIAASKTLKHGTADIGKSTICRLLKKELQNQEG